MHAPRRKPFNSVNTASLARWIVVTAFLAFTGLIYVYLSLQLYHLGDRKKALENELASLRSQNDVASVQIAALTSRSALQRPLKNTSTNKPFSPSAVPSSTRTTKSSPTTRRSRRS